MLYHSGKCAKWGLGSRHQQGPACLNPVAYFPGTIETNFDKISELMKFGGVLAASVHRIFCPSTMYHLELVRCFVPPTWEYRCPFFVAKAARNSTDGQHRKIEFVIRCVLLECWGFEDVSWNVHALINSASLWAIPVFLLFGAFKLQGCRAPVCAF